MPKSLSNRTLNIAASLTVAIDSLAKKMIAEGKDVVSLGAGEPDFPTPEPICKAAHSAIDSGKTRYTAPIGILELRKKICENWYLGFKKKSDGFSWKSAIVQSIHQMTR